MQFLLHSNLDQNNDHENIVLQSNEVEGFLMSK
jgi:hypothetical protein